MFKRLAKSKRHSVEGVAVGGEPLPLPLPLSPTPTLTPTSSPPPSPAGSTISPELRNLGVPRATRAKQARRSCGDQPLPYDDDERDADHRSLRITRVNAETDYQMVTAVPAYIVEHEPEKQKGLGIWGRRMSKKIDSFRRSSCRDAETQGFSGPQQRSASPFKSFFIRMGSTGMLNSTKSNRRSLPIVDDRLSLLGSPRSPQGSTLRSTRSPEAEQAPLFRSCSTSQLNATLTYVKGDDPSEGIDLRMSGRDNGKTVSCDDLAAQLLDDVFEPAEVPLPPSPNSGTFHPCDFDDARRGRVHLVRKSVSCEFREPRESGDSAKEPRKSNFPYAFLRSKLSVLPEERHSGAKHSTDERLFKTVSEEHFPSLLRVDEASRTTTLGRRKSRTNGSSVHSFGTGSRNSYSEYRVDSDSPLTSDYADILESSATLRCHRRNSAPSAEQRLSSHYVSSNESGYDSDGPRGESAAASEAEALSLNRADSSDTSSVVDSEMEKPTRSSTPSEYPEHAEGLRWHQTTSGRLLPSVNQESGESILQGVIASSPHRARLQRDKSRFLSDIVQPIERTRRCRLVDLTKNDPTESLGIRLAQQRSDRLRYVVVELENKGIAHRDGRLRLGDEIVEVEGRDLGTLESLQAVQDFLASFKGNRVQLLTAFEETVPQVCVASLGILPGETEYFENAKSLSNISLCDDRRPVAREKTPSAVNNSSDILLEAHRYPTRLVARFEKGYGRPSLGFSVVGGRDSPRGEMGIFVRRVFPGGQADVSKSLLQGDEILSLNGKILRGYTHREVIELFKAVREGSVELEIARRFRYPKSVAESTTY